MNDSLKIRLEMYGGLKIEPKGRSMLPFLKEGRDAVILTVPKRPIRKYDIVLYKHGGVYVLHRVTGAEEDVFIICGDNSRVLERVEGEKIIGVAAKVLRGNKGFKPDCLCMSLAVRLWYGFGIKRAVMMCRRIFARCRRNK